ncbi:hypothetical protein [Pseudochrobactrum sp. MP213Fo]|uniref:hypothetical protein n=1 Tax=Pseudochrobactrum sp. MP213Fo TaxID=3022250 RepID=UPI003B9E19AB
MTDSRSVFLESGLLSANGGLVNTGIRPLDAAGFPLPNKINLSSDTFQVEEYLKFKRYKNSDGSIVESQDYLDDTWFVSRGLRPVNLVYGARFLDGKGLAAKLNENKLRDIAKNADPLQHVSLDAEEWNQYRFQPNKPLPDGQTIVQNLAKIVSFFKQVNPAAQVGLYSEVPQNTYGYNEKTAAIYDKLNPEYVKVAKAVDYYSPSLYNYGHYDGTAEADMKWRQAAEYAAHACQLLDNLNQSSKPVFPYISPGWKDKSGQQRYLTYDQMHFRLTSLKALNAKGCILWLSSNAKEQDGGEGLALDPYNGWLKAAIDFQ